MLRGPGDDFLKAPKEAVLANLHSTEHNLAKNTKRSGAHCLEIRKLAKAKQG